MALFKQKMVWIGIVIIFVVLMVFGLAMMGSVIGAKPQNLPVALVVEDQAVSLPNGTELNVGQLVKEKLTANPALPIKWTIVGSEAEAREGLDQQDYYGAFVLPADLSAGVASITTASPKPAVAKIIANDGMNAQASSAVKQILGQAARMISSELSNQLLTQISTNSEVVPVGTAKALLTPFTVQEETVHAIGANNASGNAPGMLTQIMWIGSLVTSLILFFASRKAAESGAERIGTTIVQAIIGIVFVTAVSGFLVWMAHSWYGMELVDAGGTWLMLLVAGIAFFLLQSALVNWLGMAAMPILILLMFFSLPVVNMAPEFLPQTTHDWLYSWTPFRFAASGLRNSMYFNEVDAATTNLTVLASIAAAGLVLVLASAFKKSKAGEGETNPQ
ncbi:phage infection protein [Paenibacillus sp. CCS19]|uniref:YhgE/Pip domain-containing protein n=1 Tax=Paenibacillus sp. CCS19 TaxID=3158387 RepID=UPI00255F3698|nr:ABC transporter permease [Paenibacillus cellulosilyticus]GMK38794.1 phage infection protein [Paenibacillus cellulosilyticus]